MLIQFSVRIAGHSRYGNTTSDVLEVLAEVDAGDGDVGAALPGPVLRAEAGDGGVGTGLVSVQPGDVISSPALILHLATLCGLGEQKYFITGNNNGDTDNYWKGKCFRYWDNLTFLPENPKKMFNIRLRVE